MRTVHAVHIVFIVHTVDSVHAAPHAVHTVSYRTMLCTENIEGPQNWSIADTQQSNLDFQHLDIAHTHLKNMSGSHSMVI